MTNDTSQTLDLRKTAEQLRIAQDAVTRMRAALEKVGPAPVAGPENNAAAEARRVLEDALAAQSLGEADEATVAEARKKYDQIVKADQAAAAKVRADEDIRIGLQRRLVAAEADLDKANTEHENAVRAAHVVWAVAELDAADQRYADAAMVVSDSWARVQGLRAMLQKLGVMTPGSPVFREEPRMLVIGNVSADLARSNRPNESSEGYVWSCTVQPRIDSTAVIDVISEELASLDLQNGDADQSAGVVGQAFQRIVQKFSTRASS